MFRSDPDTSSRPRPEARGVTIREATAADAQSLVRLAALDSRRVPAGRVVVAELDGELLAAVPVNGGEPVADPFRRTAELVRLLELRAAQLREAAAEGERLHRRRGLRPLTT